jgi:hypothetical protein
LPRKGPCTLIPHGRRRVNSPNWVWHWGETGKTHLPNLPRGAAVEFNPFYGQDNLPRTVQFGLRLLF